MKKSKVVLATVLCFAALGVNAPVVIAEGENSNEVTVHYDTSFWYTTNDGGSEELSGISITDVFGDNLPSKISDTIDFRNFAVMSGVKDGVNYSLGDDSDYALYGYTVSIDGTADDQDSNSGFSIGGNDFAEGAEITVYFDVIKKEDVEVTCYHRAVGDVSNGYYLEESFGPDYVFSQESYDNAREGYTRKVPNYKALTLEDFEDFVGADGLIATRVGYCMGGEGWSTESFKYVPMYDSEPLGIAYKAYEHKIILDVASDAEFSSPDDAEFSTPSKNDDDQWCYFRSSVEPWPIGLPHVQAPDGTYQEGWREKGGNDIFWVISGLLTKDMTIEPVFTKVGDSTVNTGKEFKITYSGVSSIDEFIVEDGQLQVKQDGESLVSSYWSGWTWNTGLPSVKAPEGKWFNGWSTGSGDPIWVISAGSSTDLVITPVFVDSAAEQTEPEKSVEVTHKVVYKLESGDEFAPDSVEGLLAVEQGSDGWYSTVFESWDYTPGFRHLKDRANATFGGWLNEKGEIVWVLPAGVKSDMVLTPNWVAKESGNDTAKQAATTEEKKTFRVYYNGVKSKKEFVWNGEGEPLEVSGSADSQGRYYSVFSEGITWELGLMTLERAGYGFAGWVDEDGKVYWTVPANTNKDLVLTAKFYKKGIAAPKATVKKSGSKITIKVAKKSGYKCVYQVATDKKFKKVLVHKELKKTKFVYKKDKNEQKKTYYVRACYKKGRTWGAWSKVKKIKV